MLKMHLSYFRYVDLKAGVTADFKMTQRTWKNFHENQDLSQRP